MDLLRTEEKIADIVGDARKSAAASIRLFRTIGGYNVNTRGVKAELFANPRCTE